MLNLNWQGWMDGISVGTQYAFAAGAGLFLLVVLIGYTNILARAGYSRWWILILLVPVLNLIMLLVFAYKKWPVQRELRELRELRDRTGGYGYQGTGGYPATGYNQPGGYPQ